MKRAISVFNSRPSGFLSTLWVYLSALGLILLYHVKCLFIMFDHASIRSLKLMENQRWVWWATAKTGKVEGPWWGRRLATSCWGYGPHVVCLPQSTCVRSCNLTTYASFWSLLQIAWHQDYHTRWRTQSTSATVKVMLRNSASVLERTTLVFFLEL